jgi:hypothetical protein
VPTRAATGTPETAEAGERIEMSEPPITQADVLVQMAAVIARLAQIDARKAELDIEIEALKKLIEAEEANPQKEKSKMTDKKQISETLANALFISGAIELSQRERVATVLDASLWGLVELAGVLTPKNSSKVVNSDVT